MSKKQAIAVKAKHNGYRRAGFKFSNAEFTKIPLDQISEEQVAALSEDPNLLVAATEISDAAEDSEEVKAAGKKEADQKAKPAAKVQKEADEKTKPAAKVKKEADEKAKADTSNKS